MSCEKDERDINEVDDDDDVQIRANYAKKHTALRRQQQLRPAITMSILECRT